jgi:DNA-binding MarR family transcriptional regulator
MMDVMTTPPPSLDLDREDLVEDAERLRLATTRLARILRQETHTGLTPTQVAALATLQRMGAVPLKALAEAERISAPTATKVVDKLAEVDLVERLPHPDDRRVTLVSVTPAGHDLLAATRRHKTAWLATRLADLSPTDRSRLLDAVEVIEHLVAPDAAGSASPTDDIPVVTTTATGTGTATGRPVKSARTTKTAKEGTP